MTDFAVILAAAGQSTRFADKNYKKPFAPLENKAVWLHSADKFLKRDDVKQLIVVLNDEDREDFQTRFGANIAILGIDLVAGGARRSESIRNGLAAVRDDINMVAVHDAARPCLADVWLDRVFEAAIKHGAAILAIPVTSTLKLSSDGKTVSETVSRANLWAAQTPQVFRKQILQDAYKSSGWEDATDDAQLVERTGNTVHMVTGSALNLKITTRDDLRAASASLKALPRQKNIGPAHPFEDDHLWR